MDPDPDPQHAYFINVGSRNIADLGAAKLWVRLSYGCGVTQIVVSRGLLYGRPGGFDSHPGTTLEFSLLSGSGEEIGVGSIYHICY